MTLANGKIKAIPICLPAIADAQASGRRADNILMLLIGMKTLVEKDLSFQITGFCYKVHNDLGRFLTERQYADAFEAVLKESGLHFEREPSMDKYYEKEILQIGRPDFIVEDRIVVDLKAKPFVTKEDYYQMQKYLSLTGKELGLIINFHLIYIKPKRILNHRIFSYSEHSDDPH